MAVVTKQPVAQVAVSVRSLSGIAYFVWTRCSTSDGGLRLRNCYQARIGLLSLFSQESNDLRYVCFPTGDSETAIDIPPSTSVYHLEEFLALTPGEKSIITNGKEQLQRALDALFAGDGSSAAVLHNDSLCCGASRTVRKRSLLQTASTPPRTLYTLLWTLR